jgi:hypothetical protein
MTQKAKTLNNIAEGIADITLELMHDSIDWQLSDYPQDGIDYEVLHQNILKLAIKKMFESTDVYKTYTSINR